MHRAVQGPPRPAWVGGTAGATGSAPADRNVFADTLQAIRVVGADDTVIQGNYFGRKPSGAAAGVGFSGIETSRGADGDVPQRTLIGGEATGTALASAACDGPCKVITRFQRDVDLDPDLAPGPAGETIVAGNYLEVTPDGLSTDGGLNCIRAGRATPVLVGGPADGDRNRFGWCNAGVYGQNPGELAVVNNSFGLQPDGTLLDHTSFEAAVYLTGGLSGALVADNEIAGMGDPDSGNMPNYGIHLTGNGAVVLGNTVGLDPGSSTPRFFHSPIYVNGDENIIGTGDPDDANTIRNGKDAGVHIPRGIDNAVAGNLIEQNNGPGIRLERPGGSEVDGNYLGRNRGTGNTRPFIDLVPTAGLGVDPEDGPNGGIEPPTLLGARPDRAVGVAEPGAEVLVYRRANNANSGDAGDLAGEATAAEDGRFTISSLASPGPGELVAMQSLDIGSSELSDPLQPAAATDTTAPNTAIAAGPGPFTKEAVPSWVLSSDEPASYICRLDGPVWSACPNQISGPELEEGAHKFEAIASDAAGNSDATPAVSAFTVDMTPPDTTIVSFPSPLLAHTSADVRLSASEPALSYSCAFDDRDFPCGTRVTIGGLAGRHLFKAAAKDRAGNVDPTPATKVFDILPRPPATQPPQPQRIDIDALLGADLARVPRRLTALQIRGLLRRSRGVAVTGIGAAAAGTLQLQGTAQTAGVRTARRVRVLTATKRFTSAGIGSLTVRLTRAGKRLLRNSQRRVALSLTLTFTDAQGSTARRTAKLRLRR